MPGGACGAVTSYAGRHAELYDLIYADKPYEAESRCVDGLIREFDDGKGGRRLLEMACGTGRHALQLEWLGHEVNASDYSASMVAVAQARGKAEGASARFEVRDMRTLGLTGAGFDSAVCLFDSIGYLQTNDGIRAALGEIHAALRPGGVFVFEFWHAPAMLRSYDPVRVRRIEVPGRELVRISETSLDVARQLCTVAYEILELYPDGRYSRVREAQQNRYFFVPEMALFLESAGFAPLTFRAGYTDSEVIDESTWHVLAVARRR